MEKEINCVYGSQHTIGTLFIYGDEINGYWYVVEGSVNINKTLQDLDVGTIDIETLEDVDVCTSQEPINSIEDLKRVVDDD